MLKLKWTAFLDRFVWLFCFSATLAPTVIDDVKSDLGLPVSMIIFLGGSKGIVIISEALDKTS